MLENFLPIGSVVLLKGAKKRLMITGYCLTDKNDNNKKYDYCGCLYPEGIVDANKIALFNHSQIDKVYFIGMQDVEEYIVKKKIDKILSQKDNVNNSDIKE